MVSADRELWDDADRYFRRSLEIAEAIGDIHLQGLGLLNHAEVHLARQRYEQARQNAEAALGIFDQLGSRLDKADAYKVIGRVYRETGRHALAESRLRSAIELAVSTGSILSEAEASRELALLYQSMGRNQEALRLLNAAHRLFGRLDARVDLVDVSTKVAQAGRDLLRGGAELGPVDRIVRQLHLRPLRAGGRVMPWRWPGSWGWTRSSRPPSGSAPICTTWARSGCRTRS